MTQIATQNKATPSVATRGDESRGDESPKLEYQIPRVVVFATSQRTLGSNIQYILESQGGGPYGS